MGERSVTCLRRVATGSAYKMIWTRVAYAGIEIISIPAYAHVALPVATLAQAYIVNRPLQDTLRARLRAQFCTGKKGSGTR